jgi:hypothetical protein
MYRFVPLIAVFLLSVGSSPSAFCSIFYWSPADGGNGNFYQLVTDHLPWTDAKSAAESMLFGGAAGHLATVTSQAEHDFLAAAGLVTTTPWIGGHLDGSSWQWVTGEDFTYTRWGKGEPNNRTGDEDAIHYKELGWNDNASWRPGPYLVEYETADHVLPADIPFQPQTRFLNSGGAVLASRYDLGFFDGTLKIDLAIHLIGDDPGATLRAIWESETESIWNSQFRIQDGANLYGIELNVDFVDTDWDFEVNVLEGDFDHVNVYTWCTGKPNLWETNYQGRMAAHEVGHMLGLWDEYPNGTTDPNRQLDPYFMNVPGGGYLDQDGRFQSQSLMGSLTGNPQERHYQYLVDWLNGETGRNMVLGYAPTYDPGLFGPAVNDDPPLSAAVPEPSSFITLGGMFLFSTLGSLLRRKYFTIQ